MSSWDKAATLVKLLTTRNYCISLDTIKQELECSKATFFRLKELAEAQFGIPIVYDKKYKGYRHDLKPDQHVEIPNIWLRKDEIEAITCFSNIMGSLQKGFLTEILSPLEKRFNTLFKAQKISVTAWRERLKIMSIGNRVVDDRIFKCLAEAVLHNKKIFIEYKSLSKRTVSQRTISPFTLLRYRDNWYVDAWCDHKNDYRTFALNRIVNVKILKENQNAAPRAQIESHFADAYGIFSGKATNTAEILFTGVAAFEVSQEQWHPRQISEKRLDGSYLLKIPYNDDRELTMDILKWGNEAEVLGPKELRNKIADILAKTQTKYRKKIRKRPVS